VVHAGSDLGRLSLIPEFQSAYQLIFQNCTFVAIRRRNVALITERLAISPEKIVVSRSGRMLPSYFHEHIRTITLEQLKVLTRDHLKNNQIDPELNRWAAELNKKQLDASVSVLGVYGKAGEQKGHHELIAALTHLAKSGVKFHLLICTGGHRRNIERLMLLIRQSQELSIRTFWFPFISPWRIPGFIKLCDAVAFLERGFEIDFHGPQVPKEVLWCGRALICSKEIADKQIFKDALVDQHNFIDGGDPRDVAKLTQVLQQALGDKEKLRTIGFAGSLMLKNLMDESMEDDGVVAALRSRELLSAHGKLSCTAPN
jgi:glycosyltransferase involved in cell wall biosynthesis